MGERPLLLALDIGNVCVKIDYSVFAGLFGTSRLPEQIRELLRAFEFGKLDEADFFARLIAFGGGRFTEEAAMAAFDGVLYESVPGMTELVKTFPARNIRACFLSDISPRHLRRTREIFPAAELIPDGIYSFAAGAWKPAPEMLGGFEKNFGRPDLYIDDRCELTGAAADKFSWNTHCFTSAEQLDAVLKELEKR